jgi:ribosomal-protein-alanine N-acetyltransferase
MLIAARYDVRPMTEADINQVAAIERESFPTTWPQTAYRRELANKLARYLVVVDKSRRAAILPSPTRRSLFSILKRPEQTYETTDYIVGYVGIWLMVDEAHIVAIAVREAYRGKGLGELLLAASIDVALANGQEVVTLEVRRSNTIAQTLYEKYRFLKVGVRKRYYSDNGEDGIIMSTPPIRGGSFQEHFEYLKQERERRWNEEP